MKEFYVDNLARIDIVSQSQSGFYVLRCHAHPELFISAKKNKVSAGGLTKFSYFQLFMNKAGHFVFLSKEYQNQNIRLFLAAIIGNDSGVQLSKFIFTNGGIGLLKVTPA
eukprot:m.140347 g.140347  ORF g.140347 m.140347 type:complete len:110 (+) comp38298_c0_seq29:983-1312(+)